MLVLSTGSAVCEVSMSVSEIPLQQNSLVQWHDMACASP